MKEMSDRLKEARAAAGYASARSAAMAFGWSYTTYAGHENGSRGFDKEATRYAKVFRVSLEWLLTGKGEMKPSASSDGSAEIINIWSRIPKRHKEAAKEMLKGLADDAG